MIDGTSFHDYMQELDAYENKYQRQKLNNMSTNLEDKLDTVYVGFTDVITHYGNTITQPDYIHWYIKKELKSILVACKDKSYIQVATATYEAVTGEKLSQRRFNKLSNKDRRLLYNYISNHPGYKVFK